MSYDIEHGGLHELYYLDGLATAAERTLQLFEEAIMSQQHTLQDAANDLDASDTNHHYSLDDITALKDAADDVRLAARRVIVARSSIRARLG